MSSPETQSAHAAAEVAPTSAAAHHFAHAASHTAERAETARKDALEVGRKAALAPFVADVALYARALGLDMEVPEQRRQAASEFLAHIAEVNADQDQSFLRRVYQAIRAVLRKLGLAVHFTDAGGQYLLTGLAPGTYQITASFTTAYSTSQTTVT